MTGCMLFYSSPLFLYLRNDEVYEKVISLNPLFSNSLPCVKDGYESYSTFFFCPKIPIRFDRCRTVLPIPLYGWQTQGMESLSINCLCLTAYQILDNLLLIMLNGQSVDKIFRNKDACLCSHVCVHCKCIHVLIQFHSFSWGYAWLLLLILVHV